MTLRRLNSSAAAFWLTIALLSGVPLVFCTSVYNIYSIPKFALLLAGAAALAPFVVWAIARGSRQAGVSGLLTGSTQAILVSLYLIVIAASTLLGPSPLAEAFGSSYNRTGLITHICFFIVFLSLIVSVGRSEKRLRTAMWAMTLTGLAVSTYAYAQFFGRDPFVVGTLYTFASETGTVVRVNSTLGHSDYLGNFLLYVAPLGAGLALASRGHARRIGFGAAVLSTAAIVFTGTRGAWLGAIVAVFAFTAANRSGRITELFGARRPNIRLIAATVVAILLFAVLIGLHPASRNITMRSRSFIEDRFTGAGRTTLWRDAIKMVIRYPLIGCGPEGFREAFLPYKSPELAHLAPSTNNESSHNSYIDSALCYGLPGAILYVAILALSFALLARARRRSTDKEERIIRSSLIASLAGVAVHNIFIFDQISTGLYFFSFAAFAQIAWNTVAAELTDQASREPDVAIKDGARLERVAVSRPSERRSSQSAPFPGSRSVLFRVAPVLTVAAIGLLLAAVWYAVEVTRADFYLSKAISSASAGDLNGVIEHGDRAVWSPDPTGDTEFLYARALALCADNLAEAKTASLQNHPAPSSAALARNQAIRLAMLHAEKSLGHSLTPSSSYVLLAYLALQLGDADKMFAYSEEAVTRDPNFSNAHWLKAEAFLAKDSRADGASEARIALDLDPGSTGARSALKRSKGMPHQATPEVLIEYGIGLASEGKTTKALRVLRRAIRKSNGHCPDCNAAMASIFERASLYHEAIAEWEAFAREAPQRAVVEKTALRIEKLRQQTNPTH